MEVARCLGLHRAFSWFDRDCFFGGLQAARPRLRLFCSFDRLDVLALAAVAEFLPALPCRWFRFQRAHQVSWRLDFAFRFAELEGHTQRFVPFEPCRFSIALSQRNTRTITHRGDGAWVGITVQRDPDRRAHLPENGARVERHWDEAHRTVSHEADLERLFHCDPKSTGGEGKKRRSGRQRYAPC